MGQAALIVSEPHAELNVGLIVIFRSSHPSLFDADASEWHVSAVLTGLLPSMGFDR